MIVSLMTAFVFTTGCASIFSNSSYQVEIQNSKQADRYEVVDVINNQVVTSGTQSKQVTLEASAGFFEKASYQVIFYRNNKVVERRQLHARFDGVTMVNILFWPGFFIDGGTGAFYKLPAQI